MTFLNLARDEDLNRGRDGANEEEREFRNLLGCLYRKTQDSMAFQKGKSKREETED